MKYLDAFILVWGLIVVGVLLGLVTWAFPVQVAVVVVMVVLIGAVAFGVQKIVNKKEKKE